MMRKRNFPTIIIIIGLFLISLAVYVGTSFDVSANHVLPSYNVQNGMVFPLETIKDEQTPLTPPQPSKQPGGMTIRVKSVQ